MIIILCRVTNDAVCFHLNSCSIVPTSPPQDDNPLLPFDCGHPRRLKEQPIIRKTRRLLSALKIDFDKRGKNQSPSDARDRATMGNERQMIIVMCCDDNQKKVQKKKNRTEEGPYPSYKKIRKTSYLFIRNKPKQAKHDKNPHPPPYLLWFPTEES